MGNEFEAKETSNTEGMDGIDGILNGMDFDMAKLASLMDMAREFAPVFGATNLSSQKDTVSPHNLEIAAISESPRLNALKAAVVYLEPQHQKNLSIMIKLMEIRVICKYYDNLSHGNTENPPRPIRDANWRRKSLNAIMPYLDQNRQKTIRSFGQILEMQEVISNFEKFKEMSIE